VVASVIIASMFVFKRLYNSLSETFFSTLLARPKGFLWLAGTAVAGILVSDLFFKTAILAGLKLWFGLNPFALVFVVVPVLLLIFDVASG